MTGVESKYTSLLNGTYILMQEPERYINHSCEANTTAKDFCDVARRDIKKGEEITADYREDTQAKGEMKCRCGSPTCKKILRR
jgi:SET domain-containing protein